MPTRDRLATFGGHLVPPNEEQRLLVAERGSSVDVWAPDEAVPQSGREDLEFERKGASFNSREMYAYIHGGEQIAKLRQDMLLQFERDPSFNLSDSYDLTKEQQRVRAMTRLRSIAHFVTMDSPKDFILRMRLLILVDPGFMTRFAVHYGLFYNTIMNQGTPEQVAYWTGRGALNLKGLIGCYAMTELAHGSNVAGIETIATFDHDSDEFIIHTPTLTATKWWIGGAAESATHATVFANLVVDGKRYGVKPFVVPLRDLETFVLLPGIAIGDCGSKMGRNAIDNGWIQFTQVRIPRTSMLMRYTKVSRDGRVTEPPMAQLAYGALIFGRTTIISESSECAKKALAIAVRFGCVRRQFGTQGGFETKIIDYQIHQQRLIPLLALTYALAFGSIEIQRIYENLMIMLEQANPADPSMAKTIDALKETHSTIAGLKALCTWNTLDLIERCRQTLGGLGYSSYAGLASLFQDFAVQCTWEGDNTVLTLQTGRYLISCVREVAKGKKLPDGVWYLNQLPQILTKTCSNSDVSEIDTIKEAFGVTAANFTIQAAKAYEGLVAKGLTEDEAQLECGVQKAAAAKIHCTGYLFQRFYDGVVKAPSGLSPVLTDLCKLYGLSAIQENAGAFLQCGYFKPGQMKEIGDKILELFHRLRPQLVPLTDSFGLSDYAINSPLGCYDGDIYRRLFDRVKQCNPIKPHLYFESVIKPALFRKDPVVEKIQINE